LSQIGIVTALRAEARTLGRSSPTQGLARLTDGSLLIVSGIGAAAAGQGARTLVGRGVSGLMSWGVAGGLDPSLPAGTLLLPEDVVDTEGRAFATAREWRERVAAALSGEWPHHAGRLLSSPRAIDTVPGKAAAFRTTRASAVDMESLAIAEVAFSHRLPFLAVRVIVDTASDALPRSVIEASRSGRVDLGRLLRGLALAPFEIVALLRLARRYRRARQALVAVARRAGPWSAP